MIHILGGIAVLAYQCSPGGSGVAGIEGVFTGIVSWIKLALEIISALVVSTGALAALCQLMRMLLSPDKTKYYQRLRLKFSRSLILALEFQLAADILGTTVAPTWEQLGKLGAIAVIRTFLNYFLGREVKEIETEEDNIKRLGNRKTDEQDKLQAELKN